MKRQSDKMQKGEIEFRKKLIRQQIDGERNFKDEYDAEGIEKILSERMRKTHDQMLTLKKQGVTMSPYLEIGAERCQRSLVMENDLGVSGAAIDISYDMLKSCDHYKDLFNKNKVPLRVCCDANNLPFLSGSIPFVFCYETLHHFPDPYPIVKELYRVLASGGHFFFNEEPYKKVLHVNMYSGNKVHANKEKSRGLRKIKNFLDGFFAKTMSNEIEYNIVENNDISVETWKKTLGFFEEKNINLNSHAIKRNVTANLFYPKSYARFLLAYLFGGEISGICRKAGEPCKKVFSVQDALVCPTCLKSEHEIKLNQKDSALICGRCNTAYPIHNGVVFLFCAEKLEELYPEIPMESPKTTGIYTPSTFIDFGIICGQQN